METGAACQRNPAPAACQLGVGVGQGWNPRSNSTDGTFSDGGNVLDLPFPVGQPQATRGCRALEMQ